MDQISISHVRKVYQTSDVETIALDDISFSIKKGEFVAIVGPSGSGKSTLMHVLGALDTPTSGIYILDGQDVSKLSKDELAEIRNKKIGFVFQSFNLLPRTTALKNVALPMTYAGVPKVERLKKAEELLKEVGLGDRINHTSSQLSGGQMQRVAIARALVNRPKILLADEPTGALDSKTGEEILKLFLELNNHGVTVIVVTHDNIVANRCRRVLRMVDGILREDTLI